MQKSVLLLCAYLLLFLDFAFGQPSIQWQKCYGGSKEDVIFYSNIRQTIDGGYIFTGYTKSNDSSVVGNHDTTGTTFDAWVVKIDSLGAIQWQHCLGGSGNERGQFINQVGDGGYILAGFAFSNNGDVAGNHGGGDGWIVKLDSSGSIVWQKCVGGSGTDALTYFQEAIDGFIVGGSTTSNDGDVSGNHNTSGGYYDVWLAKFSGNGVLEWQKCFGGSKSEGGKFKRTIDGGYILAGYTASNDGDVSGNHDTTGLSNDCWIVKLDSIANISWQKTLGGRFEDGASDIIQESDGGYIFSALANSLNGDVTGNHGPPDMWVVRLDSTGTIMWKRCYGGTGREIGTSIFKTSDGNYVVSGMSDRNNGDVSGVHNSPGNEDYWIIKIDTVGNLLWQKCLGGNFDDIAYSIEQTPDEGFIASGVTWSFDGDVSGFNGGVSDIWVVKLTPAAVGIEEIENNLQVKGYPNPVSDEFTIQSSICPVEKIEVYNLIGVKLMDKKCDRNASEASLEMSPLKAGLYFVKILTGKGNVTFKVIKE